MTDKEKIKKLWAVIDDLEDYLGPAGAEIVDIALESHGLI